MLDWLEKHQLPCFYHQVLGFECPACGFQHAFILLLRGDFRASLIAWPALIPTLIIFILLISWLATGKPGWKVMKILLWIELALVLISWIIRLVSG